MKDTDNRALYGSLCVVGALEVQHDFLFTHFWKSICPQTKAQIKIEQEYTCLSMGKMGNELFTISLDTFTTHSIQHTAIPTQKAARNCAASYTEHTGRIKKGKK